MSVKKQLPITKVDIDFAHREAIRERQAAFQNRPYNPRLTHTKMGQINPVPVYVKPEPKHKLPSTLQFDGSTMKPRQKKEKIEIPEHLVRPPLDEEALMRARAKD